MLDREPAIRAAISAQGHLRAELEAPTDVAGDIARAERAVDAYLAQPVEVTDEMVMRAEAAYEMDGYMRAALEAALNPQP